MTQLLRELLGPEVEIDRDAGAIVISDLSADSRLVLPGHLFAAMASVKADGGRFIADALSKGAAALLVGHDALVPDTCAVPVLRAQNPRRALALIAARFFGAQPATIVAVTGTSGKTSVVEFTRQIFAHLGHRAASVGTIGVVTPEGVTYGSLTTPDPISLARTLSGLASQGITKVAMEASSHGLDQFRLDGVKLTAGAFTNLGRDHMDYHPNLEHYFFAKMRLLRELLPPKAAVIINCDGAYADSASTVAGFHDLRVISVGKLGETIKLLTVTRDGFRQQLTVEVNGQTRTIDFPLVGAYQIENALTAAGLAIAVGGDPGRVLDALADLKGVPGRLDIVGEANGALAVVDYAHKPEALTAALDAVRPFATGRLICVFGCGGDRDRGKRPIMGKIAVEKADVVIITDDNPRTEVPAVIRAEILIEAKGAREIGDRTEAINAAVAMMGRGDVVLVAGKGHETGQIVGDSVLPFSDRAVLEAALAKVRLP